MYKLCEKKKCAELLHLDINQNVQPKYVLSNWSFVHKRIGQAKKKKKKEKMRTVKYTTCEGKQVHWRRTRCNQISWCVPGMPHDTSTFSGAIIFFHHHYPWTFLESDLFFVVNSFQFLPAFFFPPQHRHSLTNILVFQPKQVLSWWLRILRKI